MAQLKTYSIDDVALAVKLAFDIFTSPPAPERWAAVAALAGMDSDVFNKVVELVEERKSALTGRDDQ